MVKDAFSDDVSLVVVANMVPVLKTSPLSTSVWPLEPPSASLLFALAFPSERH
jgi:hypothetical protein